MSTNTHNKKDWDKIVSMIEDEPPSTDIMKFFKDLYGKADSDAKRAMQKSIQESRGTVLSTDWKQVGSAKVEPVQPK